MLVCVMSPPKIFPLDNLKLVATPGKRQNKKGYTYLVLSRTVDLVDICGDCPRLGQVVTRDLMLCEPVYLLSTYSPY